MAKASLLPVMEIFGPTIQGEGSIIGRKTMFIRTAGCDYSCSWCDSSFTWDGSGKDMIRLLTPQEMMDELKRVGGDGFNHVTLSGGNPALLPGLGAFISMLHGEGMKVALETQGSKWQPWFHEVDELTLSPKPPSSGMSTDWDVLDHIMSKLVDSNNSISLKVVIFDQEDLRYAKTLHQRYSALPIYLQTGNGNLSESDPQQLLLALVERYEWLLQQTLHDDDFREVYVLPQLHTWVWGNKRGV